MNSATNMEKNWGNILWTLRQEYVPNDEKEAFDDHVQWYIGKNDTSVNITFTVSSAVMSNIPFGDDSPHIKCRYVFLKTKPRKTTSTDGTHHNNA